ncbi:hypothetical protein JCM10213_001343 [Rhodosporidiobolus nylandii]
MRSFALLTLFCAPATLARVYIYKPVESSNYQPGDSFTVSWRDDGNTPSWTAWGPSTVGLYTGSPTSQTLLADLGSVNDASETYETRIVIDGKWGGDSSDYFIRVQSESATSDNGDPLQAFSARFTLSKMTGEFSDEVKAQLAGSAASSPASVTAAAAGASDSSRITAAASSVGTGSLATQARIASTSSLGSGSTARPTATASTDVSAAVGGKGVAGGAVVMAALALVALA